MNLIKIAVVHYCLGVSPQFQGGFLHVTSTQVKCVGQDIGVTIRKYEKHCRAHIGFTQCKHTFLWLFSTFFCSDSSHKLGFIFFLFHKKIWVFCILSVIQNLSTMKQMNYGELYLQMHGLGYHGRMWEAQGQTVRQRWRRKHALHVLIPVPAPLWWSIIQISVGMEASLRNGAKKSV